MHFEGHTSAHDKHLFSYKLVNGLTHCFKHVLSIKDSSVKRAKKTWVKVQILPFIKLCVLQLGTKLMAFSISLKNIYYIKSLSLPSIVLSTLQIPSHLIFMTTAGNGVPVFVVFGGGAGWEQWTLLSNLLKATQLINK